MYLLAKGSVAPQYVNPRLFNPHLPTSSCAYLAQYCWSHDTLCTSLQQWKLLQSLQSNEPMPSSGPDPFMHRTWSVLMIKDIGMGAWSHKLGTHNCLLTLYFSLMSGPVLRSQRRELLKYDSVLIIFSNKDKGHCYFCRGLSSTCLGFLNLMINPQPYRMQHVVMHHPNTGYTGVWEGPWFFFVGRSWYWNFFFLITNN